MEDGFATQDYLTTCHPASVEIIGADYIGMEMADALTGRGLLVAVVEYTLSVLTTFDPVFGNVVWAEVIRHGVCVSTGLSVDRIESGRKRLDVFLDGSVIQADMVLVAAGSRPESRLAQPEGIATTDRGAIAVNRRMETNVPDIYAVGDCAETYHRMPEKNTYLPLETTAHKQGRIAGGNAAGGRREKEPWERNRSKYSVW